MPKIGIRELKEQATAVVRRVREEGTEYVITLRGEPVAVILPVERTNEGGAPQEPDRADLRRRALALSGQFRSGRTDISAEHDRYLAESDAP
jgi:prevent-host-death family protein